jgi:8-oxo-dGTP diphosphatase
MTEYATGFLFDKSKTQVALIVKTRPQWQAGKLNGIGGHVDRWRHQPGCPTESLIPCDQMNYDPCTCGGETPDQAMQREFREETGLNLDAWEKFTVLEGYSFRVHFYRRFVTSETLYQAKSMTDEEVRIVDVKDIPVLSTIPNLRWLIPMALSMDDDRAASFVVREVAA